MAALVLVATAGRAEGPPGSGWELAKDTDGVKLYERTAAEDESLREAYAETAVDAPPERILRALRDYATFPEWSPYTEETRLLRQDGPNVDLVFQRMDLPWPAGNRYYTLRFELSGRDPADGSYVLRWALAPPDQRFQCEDCGVEMPLNRGAWTLKPLDGGSRTALSCLALTDPGGHLPRFAIRAANGRMFPRLVAAVRERASLPRYAEPEPPR